MDGDRSTERTLISEGTMARGRPLRHPSPHPIALCYLSHVTCYAKNAECPLTLAAKLADERGRATKLRPAVNTGVDDFL